MAQKHPKILEMWKPENMVENSLLLDRLDQFYKNIDDSYIDFIIPYDVMKKKDFFAEGKVNTAILKLYFLLLLNLRKKKIL